MSSDVAFEIALGKSSVIASRCSVLLMAAIAGCVALQPSRAHAQWWPHAPADFEECADAAEKASTKEDKSLRACRMQREIRRAPQARRRLHLLRFHAEPQLRYRGAESDAGRTEANRPAIYRIPRSGAAQQHRGGGRCQTAARAAAASAAGATGLFTPRRKRSRCRWKRPTSSRPWRAPDIHAHRHCRGHSFSCEWPRLSESIKDLKKMLFGSSSGNKAKRG